MRFRAFRMACALLRLSDVPRGSGWRYRFTYWLMSERYTAAEELHGREWARRFDFIPF